MYSVESEEQNGDDDDDDERVDNDRVKAPGGTSILGHWQHVPRRTAAQEEETMTNTSSDVMEEESTRPESRASDDSSDSDLKAETVCLLPSLTSKHAKVVCGKDMKHLPKDEIEEHLREHVREGKYHPTWVGTVGVDKTRRVPCGQCAAAVPPVMKRIQLRSLKRHLCEAHFQTKSFNCDSCGKRLSRDEHSHKKRHGCPTKKKSRRAPVKKSESETGA